MTGKILETYIETIYLDYIVEVKGSNGNEPKLILDWATTHLISKEFNPFTKYNINEIYVPEGLTPIFQP